MSLAMFIGVETDERGKALDEVAFKSIGTLACAVLREAELAARGHDGAHNLVGKPSGVAQLPDAPTTGGMSELGKEADAEAPAQVMHGENVRRTVRNRREGSAIRTASLPTIGRCERMAKLPPTNATNPVAAMRSHLLREWVRGTHYTTSETVTLSRTTLALR